MTPIHPKQKYVAIWLLLVAALIFAMILLGGITRLTHSGLSMVDWKPIMGVIPPLGEAQWQLAFDRYQQFPEYQIINHGISIDEFKSIFYFEYFHRLLGRLIGLAFLVPCLIFWHLGAIGKPLRGPMILMFFLGGLQGLLGWYMVKSGLVDNPQVSQYRLTAHLMAAVLIYSYMIWVALGLLMRKTTAIKPHRSNQLFTFSIGVCLLIALMIVSGGFVAGTKAGFAYPSFPLMAGQWIPEGMYALQPFWLNWFENITTVQFNHRLIAYSLMLIIPLFVIQLIRHNVSKLYRNTAIAFLFLLALQVSLGIATLLLSVPVVIAVAHQGNAILLLTLSIVIARQLQSETTEQ